MKKPKFNGTVPEHRQADFKPRTLNPPHFEYAPVEVRTTGIAFSQTVEIAKRRLPF